MALVGKFAELFHPLGGHEPDEVVAIPVVVDCMIVPVIGLPDGYPGKGGHDD